MNKEIYFTPGPSKLYPTVTGHVEKAFKDSVCSISHRGKIWEEIYEETTSGVRKILSVPENWSIFFVGSATEAMERSIQNTAEKRSVHIVCGAFGERMMKIAKALGKDTEEIKYCAKDYKNILERVKKEKDVVCITHTETSDGVTMSDQEMQRIREQNPEAVIVLDVVSSVPTTPVPFSQVDCAFFSVQKGFGLPAGLGVLLVSKRALEKSKRIGIKKKYTGSFHSFQTMYEKTQKRQTTETPNVLNIYLLGKVCQDMLSEGLETIRKKTEKKMTMIQEVVGKHHKMALAVEDETVRAKTVVVALTPEGSTEIIEKMAKKGFVIGAGYGEQKESRVRIANFSAHTEEDVKNLCKALKEV